MLSPGMRRNASAWSLTDCILFTLDSGEFNQILHKFDDSDNIFQSMREIGERQARRQTEENARQTRRQTILLDQTAYCRQVGRGSTTTCCTGTGAESCSSDSSPPATRSPSGSVRNGNKMGASLGLYSKGSGRVRPGSVGVEPPPATPHPAVAAAAGAAHAATATPDGA